MKKRILSLLLAIITVAALALPNAGSVMAASYKTFKYEMYDWDADKNVTYSCTWKYESKTQSLYFSKGDVPAAYDAENQNHPWAKYMNQVMSVLDRARVAYQMGTLGKIEKGGGGTIAYILANKGVEVVDCGTAILSMHSPFETASVVDIYMTYRAYKAFFKEMK